MRQHLKRLFDRVDSLSLRERVILFAGIVVALVVLWDAVLMQPLALRQKVAQQRLETLRGQLKTLNITIEQLLGARSTDPNAALRAKIQATQADIARLDARLATVTAGLVPPEQMAELLREVFAREHGLRFVRMQNTPPEPLLKDQSAGANAALYRHGLTLVFEGRYADVVDYLQALERLKWRFYWDGLDLKVERYPLNRVTLKVHTLSFGKEYLGV